MPRLFVGVPAPGDLELSGVRNALEKRAGDVKLVDPELYHVTLAFLGDTPEDEVPAIREAVEASAEGTGAHEGEAKGLGAFPSASSASVVWAGVEGTRLDPLANGLRDTLRERGIGFDDRHEFHPHLTVARLREKKDLSSLLDPHSETGFGAFPVDRVHLYESTLTPEGPEYEVRGTAELEG